MIRVNLLPEAQKKIARRGPSKVKREIPVMWIIIGLVAVLITTGGLAVFHLGLQKKADVIQTEILQHQNQIKKLKIDVQKVQKVKGQRNELNNKLAIIDRLKSAQKGPVHLLDQLAGCIPQRLWLTTMNEGGSSMTLEGKALEHISIARFMQNLEKSPFFSNVELASALAGEASKNQRSIEDILTFNLSCRVKIPQEFL